MALVVVPPTNLEKWIADNGASFVPPVCNKLLHRGQLSIMLVGGPNQRKDFHSEEGSEFFLQLKGSMEVVVVQEGKQKAVPINAGETYLLPSRVRHSPRRKAGSVGLVIERAREPGELDSLCWFVDEISDEVLWERYFVCTDLGKDLVPIVQEFEASEEAKTGRPRTKPLGLHIPFVNRIPHPLNFTQLVERALDSKQDLKVFGHSHPDNEFEIVLETEGRKVWEKREEMFFYQIIGSARLGHDLILKQGECCVIVRLPKDPSLQIVRDANSVGLVVAVKDLRGNKRFSVSKL
jgi:3-hydroxyanthranilate 3,4-dioxygenase